MLDGALSTTQQQCHICKAIIEFLLGCCINKEILSRLNVGMELDRCGNLSDTLHGRNADTKLTGDFSNAEPRFPKLSDFLLNG
jgi:hypothetical protein